MRKFIPIVILVAVIVALYIVFNLGSGSKLQQKEAGSNLAATALQSGDIIFHTSTSDQSQAIQLATGSELSHCGVIVTDGGKEYVLEAVQPVKLTPLETWIARGKDGRYLVKRLQNSEEVFTPTVQKQMLQEGLSMLGKNYDYYFGWSDDKIYCSELVWKLYKRGAGVELGQLQELQDFDLSSKPVKAKLKERYGNKLPLQEQVISPAAIAESDLLVTVKEF